MSKEKNVMATFEISERNYELLKHEANIMRIDINELLDKVLSLVFVELMIPDKIWAQFLKALAKAN